MSKRQRCRSCGATLAGDNTSGVCGPCESAHRDQAESPPEVPPEFWETDNMQAALASQHMGQVVRAYRSHRYHSRPLAQEVVGRWVHRGQGAISRLETGPPPTDLQELRYWARLLGIPERYLWFTLTNESMPPPSKFDALTVQEARRHVQQLGKLLEGLDSTDRKPEYFVAIDDHNRPSPSGLSEPDKPPINIDIDRAQPARMADYLLDGRSNFTVDRDMIDFVTEALPGGIETARATTQASQSFHRRALHYLAGEVGIRQFLQLGARLPQHVRPHEVVAEIAPDARVLYVMDDDTVFAHVRELRRGASANTAWIRASLRDTGDLLAKAAAELDLGERVGIMVAGVHEMLGAARDVLEHVVGGVAAGSYVVSTHLGHDLLGVETSEVLWRYKQMLSQHRMPQLGLRSRDDLAQLYRGLQLVEPGIVPVDQWRPEEPPRPHTFIYGVVAHKPHGGRS